MVTNPNAPINPAEIQHKDIEMLNNNYGMYFGLTVREHVAIQLAAGMWSNPAILQYCRGRMDIMSKLIPAEAVLGADRLINALNEPQATDYDNFFGEDENEEDKPSDYPEEK